MPVEVKPLFRPDVLRPHLAGFQMPAIDYGLTPDEVARMWQTAPPRMPFAL